MKPAHEHLPVIKTMWPLQPGTIKLLRRYGNALVCVRYRHDSSGKMRYTTVEIVVDEAPVQRRSHERKVINVRLLRPELHKRALALGAKWVAKDKAWKMSIRVARAIGILAEFAGPRR